MRTDNFAPRTRRALAILPLLVAIAGASTQAAGARPAVGCGSVVVEDVKLQGDLGPCAGDGLTVAASAVQQGPKGSYVYVVQPDGTAQLRPVTVAQIRQGQALIDGGLQANETVVVDGQYRLQQGSRVRQLHGKAAQEADLQSAVQEAIP